MEGLRQTRLVAVLARLKSWLGKKHRKAAGRKLRRIYTGDREGKQRMAHGAKASSLRFSDAKRHCTTRTEAIRIPNGWNADPDEWFRPEPTSSGRRSTPSHACEGHQRLTPRMESRMQGNSHVRFGREGWRNLLRQWGKALHPYSTWLVIDEGSDRETSAHGVAAPPRRQVARHLFACLGEAPVGFSGKRRA